uniref:Uncharacterized protein n=1 Tax=Steinernema glaseri TaxID=37863 RepID=A0A1I7YQZ3_9BILA
MNHRGRRAIYLTCSLGATIGIEDSEIEKIKRRGLDTNGLGGAADRRFWFWGNACEIVHLALEFVRFRLNLWDSVSIAEKFSH